MATPPLDEFESITWPLEENGERYCIVIGVFVSSNTPTLLVLTFALPVFDVLL